jgi:hypothetical protein
VVFAVRNMRLHLGPPKAMLATISGTRILPMRCAVGGVAVHPVVARGGPEPAGVVEADVVEVACRALREDLVG